MLSLVFFTLSFRVVSEIAYEKNKFIKFRLSCYEQPYTVPIDRKFTILYYFLIKFLNKTEDVTIHRFIFRVQFYAVSV